jgi:hypothetical protein
MYKKHFKAWGLEKNLKTEESFAMIKIRERRRLANKDTVFMRHGKPVEPGKLRRFEKRHKLTADGGVDLLHDPGNGCMLHPNFQGMCTDMRTRQFPHLPISRIERPNPIRPTTRSRQHPSPTLT